MPRAGTAGSGGGSSQPSLWGGQSNFSAPTYRPRQQPSTQRVAPQEEPSNRPLTGAGLTLSVRPPSPLVPEPKPLPDGAPGSFGIDVTSPQGLGASLGEDARQQDNLFKGIGDAVFGVGGKGGFPILGDAARLIGGVANAAFPKGSPVGEIARAVAGVPGGAIDLAGNIGKNVALAAQQLPSISPAAGADEVAMRQAFEAAPESLNKAKVRAGIAANPSTTGHQIFEFLRAQVQEQQAVNPKLFPELEMSHSGSFADDITRVMDLLGLGPRVVERTYAGVSKLSSGMDRLQEIEAVHNGAQYTGIAGSGLFTGSKGNSDIEEMAYQKWKDGTWSRDQALDFLSASGAGFAHDTGLEIASQVALDPTVWGSLGAGAAAKLGMTARRLVAQPGAAVLRAASPERLLVQGAQAGGVDISRSTAGNILEAASRIARRSKKTLADMDEAGWDTVRSTFEQGARLTSPELRGMVLPALAKGLPLSRVNILGHLAETEKATETIRLLGQHVYAPLQNSALGQAAKITRTIIDPLHAIGGKKVIPEAALDVASEVGPRAFDSAHGFAAASEVINDLHNVAPSVLASHILDKATYVANITRKVLMRMRVANALTLGAADELRGLIPKDVLGTILEHAPKDWAELAKSEMVDVMERKWDDVSRQNLGERMASMYGEKTPEQWTQWFAGKGSDYLSILHATTYGRATRDFLDMVVDATSELRAAGNLVQADDLQRLILLNKQTLTDLGAKGVIEDIDGALAKIKAAGADRVAADLAKAEAVEFGRVAQRLYPELKYIAYDKANEERWINRFRAHLSNSLEKGVLPHQLTDAEIAKHPTSLQEFHKRSREAWTLGFRPTDDHLMGLEFDLEGRLYRAFEPWVDHVGVAKTKYRGTFAMQHNAAGMPLIGTKAGRVIDYMEAGARTLTARVSSATITAAAQGRFLSLMQTRYSGVSQEEARQIFNAITETAQVHKVTVRALSADDIWKAAEFWTPQRFRLAGASVSIGKREILNAVVDAYEGDLRFVGLTQKFTGRAKALYARNTGSNFVGQFSEGLYNQVRFAKNPLFQLQEKIEPWVLNGQRGVNFALGTRFTEQDRQAARVFQRMAETGVNRAAELEQAEMSLLALIGSGAADSIGRLVEPGRLAGFMNVSGTKRINELRTLGHNFGPVVRRSWDENLPGEWDRILAQYADQAGHVISDEEGAIKWIAEQGLGQDVRVDPVIRPGATYADFKRAYGTEEWHKPATIGELKALNLDFLAEVMGLPLRDGAVLSDARALRGALADKTITMSQIEDAMHSMSMHPDYIRRVTGALDFHWDPFWRSVKQAYNATPQEIKRLQDMMAGAAKVRGMTPLDYISQVWSPDLGVGAKAKVNALDSAVSVLRAPREGATTEHLMDQLADIFWTHLDPSGRETLADVFATRGGFKGTTTVGPKEFSRAVLDKLADPAAATTPDVERAVRQFSKWAKSSLSDGLLMDDPGYADLLTRVTGIPTEGATSYNHMHQVMADQIGHGMRMAAEDAFRLQYFAKTRTFLERSLNHPFFGIYPASYMWGKILPEMVRFMARTPFGLRTGAAAYIATDVQKAIAIQMEFDPEFSQQMDKLGHSSVLWFLGYMIPTLPWDIGAAAPAWVRNLADQGLANQRRVDRGEEPKPIDFSQPIQKISDYVNPLRSATLLESPLKDVGNIIAGSTPAERLAAQQAQARKQKAAAKIGTKERGAGQTLQQSANESDLNQSVVPVLKTAQEELRDILSHVNVPFFAVPGR